VTYERLHHAEDGKACDGVTEEDTKGTGLLERKTYSQKQTSTDSPAKRNELDMSGFEPAKDKNDS